MLLVHHNVRGARRLLNFPVTTPRNEEQLVIPPADGFPSSECGVGCSAPHQTNSVRSGTNHLYSAGTLNCMYSGKTSHRTLARLYQRSHFPILTWESGTTPMVNPLSDESGEKKYFLSYVLFSYAQKSFKNVHVSLICFISISPIHGARDAS